MNYSNIQYRPVSSFETRADDAASTRFICETSWAINNLKKRVLAYKVYNKLWMPMHDALVGTEERLDLSCGFHILPPGCNKLRWWINMFKKPGEAAGDVTYTLYSSTHNIEQDWDNSVLFGKAWDSITFSREYPEIETGVVDVRGHKGSSGGVFLYTAYVADDAITIQQKSLEIQLEYDG